MMTTNVKTNVPLLLKATAVAALGALAKATNVVNAKPVDALQQQAPQQTALTNGTLANSLVTPNQSVGRSLQQVTTSVVASPPPPTYYDIFFGGNANSGAMLPDENHYGACTDPSIASTLARVDALWAQGYHAFGLDLFASNLADTATYSNATLSNIQQVVAHANSLGMNVLIGPSKDDITMVNRTPTAATTDLLVKLATTFANSQNVGLSLGGLPHNEDGSLTPAIAAQYNATSAAVRATGYRGLLGVVPPENDGRKGMDYFAIPGNQIPDPNMRFVVYPYSGGNTTEALSWLQPCVSQQRCVMVTGLQINSDLGINNNIDQVSAQLAFAKTNNIPVLLTPWDNNAIQSAGGEQVMLSGNFCTDAANQPITVNANGRSLINLQQTVVG